MNDRNYYSVLGIARTVSEAGIRDAYVRRLKEAHPDLDQSNFYPKARVEDLQRAYHCLRNAETRAAHDAELRAAELARYTKLRRLQRRLGNQKPGRSKTFRGLPTQSDMNASRWRLILLIAVAVAIGIALGRRS